MNIFVLGRDMREILQILLDVSARVGSITRRGWQCPVDLAALSPDFP